MSTTSSRNFTTLYSGAGSVVPQGAYGNANVVSLLAAGTDGANTVGNITATGAINTTGTMSATGNIVTSGYFIGSFEGNITGNVSVTGANTQVLYNNQGNVGTATGFTFNNAANVFSVPGTITAVGNVTAPYFIGNGSQLTGVATTLPSASVNQYLRYNGTAWVAATLDIANDPSPTLGGDLGGAGYVMGNVGNIQTDDFFIGNAGLLSNINGANVNGTVNSAGIAGYVTGNAQGNITSVGTLTNLTVGTYITATGNIVGANLLTSGGVTASGNVSGNYILGNGSLLTGLPSTYGNANVADFLANGFGSNTITTTGNITGGYFIGNGSLLTNINAANVVGSYGDANVVSLLGSFGSNTISTTGNVTASYFVGNGSLLTGIATSSYGNANVADFLANGFGSNTITTTGNITSGNVNTTGNIGSTQQTIIGTANATASSTGNVVVSGKNIATDVVFAPDASTTTTPTGGRILVGSGVAGNISIAAWDSNNTLRGARLAIMDAYTKNNSAVISRELSTWSAVTLDGNITAAGSRIQGAGTILNVGGGAAGNTMLPTHNLGVALGGIAGGLNVVSLGGANANLITQIGANANVAYTTATSSLIQTYGSGTYVGNAVGYMSTHLTGNATSNIRNAIGYSVQMSDNVAGTTGVANAIGYLFPDYTATSTGGQYGAIVSGSFLKGNVYAFMNAGNLAQVRLGSTLEQHYYAYPLPTTSGSVTINAVNGQVQTVTPTGAMAITDVTNLITFGYNAGTTLNVPQSQSVTVQIRQGATGYAVTLPTTLGGGPVVYADGFNTVSTTAYSTTFVTFTQSPTGTAGGTPVYCEVKSSDAGGGAAGNDGLIQFNVGGVANTGGRLGSTGNLFWTESSQTLQTQNANVTSNIVITGFSSLGSLNTYSEKQYTLSNSGTVNIDKNNGQVQYLSPVGNVTIGSLQNFVAYQGSIWQADTVTLIVKQQATPYAVTMPTGNASIKYAGNLSTIGNTANSVTMVSMTSANLSGVQTYMITVSPEFV